MAKSILRFITCGSVDDGKSTLIGRLLHDSGQLFTDQMSQLTQNNEPLAHIVDGLKAEQEQGITIDVAYRYFATDKRKFIVADTPGHEQYTRNMATGASNCDLALIIVDAERGIKQQTLRHSLICALLGIEHVLVVVNKMDAVDFQQSCYKNIQADYLQATGALGFKDVRFVPVSALHGDNVVHTSDKLNWFRGSTLLEYLENLSVPSNTGTTAFRFPVQRICRADNGFRGYAGTITSGTVSEGDAVRVLPSGLVTTVKDIVAFGIDSDTAASPSSVTLTLNDDIDVSRGDMIVPKDALPHVSQRLRATVIWMSEQPLESHREYLVKLHHKQTSARVETVHAGIDVNSGAEYSCASLALNDIGRVDFALHESVVFDAFAQNKRTGGFILIDKVTGDTVGAGTIEEPLASLVGDQGEKSAEAVLTKTRQRNSGPVIWLTGLSGAGKTTLARELGVQLSEQGVTNYLLDGDELRKGLSADLGYDAVSRTENVRRAAQVARMLSDSGVTVIVALMSPLQTDRQMARDIIGKPFSEVFVDTPLEVCQQRDPKGLYQRARDGEISDISGLDAPYEPPKTADVRVDGTHQDVKSAASQVLQQLYPP